MDICHPNIRPAVMVIDPPTVHLTTANQYRSPSQFSPLKIDIFYQQKGVRLCVSNCREIEVPILYPLFPPYSYSHTPSSTSRSVSEIELEMYEMMQDQDPVDPNLSPTTTRTKSSHDTPPQSSTPPNLEPAQKQPFPLLSLPLELRLKIYSYLLPPRHHKIVTQIPHNGSYYTSSTIPSFSTQSFYPFTTSPQPQNPTSNTKTNPKERLTTYKILTSNSHPNHPHPSIHPSILAVNHQIHTEALPLLYSYSLFDFDTHLSAATAFFSDRSATARQSVRTIKVAREIPKWIGRDAYGKERRDEGWVNFCGWVKGELRGLRGIEILVWGDSSKIQISSSGTEGVEGEVDEQLARICKEEQERKFREWGFIADLLKVEGLDEARVTWWGFGGEGEGEGEGEGKEGFDAWVRGRMSGDEVVRERMLREGRLVEGVVVLRGGAW